MESWLQSGASRLCLTEPRDNHHQQKECFLSWDGMVARPLLGLCKLSEEISTPQTANEEEEEEEEEASFTEKEITEGQPKTSPENETGQQRQNV